MVEDCYDDEKPNTTFHFNISTQTETNTDDKAVNTHQMRMVDDMIQVEPMELVRLKMAKKQIEHVYEPVEEEKPVRKNGMRESRSGFMAQAMSKTMTASGFAKTKTRSIKKPYLAIYDDISIMIARNRFMLLSGSQSTINSPLISKQSTKSNFSKVKKTTKGIGIFSPASGLPTILTEKEMVSEEVVCEDCKKKRLRRLNHPLLIKEAIDFCFDPFWSRHDRSRFRKGTSQGRKYVRTSTDLTWMKDNEET